MGAWENPTTRPLLILTGIMSAIMLVPRFRYAPPHPGSPLVVYAAFLIWLLQMSDRPRVPWWDFVRRTGTIVLTLWILYYTAKW